MSNDATVCSFRCTICRFRCHVAPSPSATFPSREFQWSSCIGYRGDAVEIRGFLPTISTASPRHEIGEGGADFNVGQDAVLAECLLKIERRSSGLGKLAVFKGVLTICTDRIVKSHHTLYIQYSNLSLPSSTRDASNPARQFSILH